MPSPPPLQALPVKGGGLARLHPGAGPGVLQAGLLFLVKQLLAPLQPATWNTGFSARILSPSQQTPTCYNTHPPPSVPGGRLLLLAGMGLGRGGEVIPNCSSPYWSGGGWGGWLTHLGFPGRGRAGKAALCPTLAV